MLTITKNTGITFSVAFLVGVGSFIWTSSQQVSEVRTQIEQNVQQIEDLKDSVSELETEGVTTQLKLTEIQTQLRGIDATLLEIKQKL